MVEGGRTRLRDRVEGGQGRGKRRSLSSLFWSFPHTRSRSESCILEENTRRGDGGKGEQKVEDDASHLFPSNHHMLPVSPSRAPSSTTPHPVSNLSHWFPTRRNREEDDEGGASKRVKLEGEERVSSTSPPSVPPLHSAVPSLR